MELWQPKICVLFVFLQKEPRNFDKGNLDLDRAARRMGHRIYDQKEQSKFGISRNEVLHIVNFELLDPGQRPDSQKNIFIPHGFEDITIFNVSNIFQISWKANAFNYHINHSLTKIKNYITNPSFVKSYMFRSF